MFTPYSAVYIVSGEGALHSVGSVATVMSLALATVVTLESVVSQRSRMLSGWVWREQA